MTFDPLRLTKYLYELYTGHKTPPMQAMAPDGPVDYTPDDGDAETMKAAQWAEDRQYGSPREMFEDMGIDGEPPTEPKP